MKKTNFNFKSSQIKEVSIDTASAVATQESCSEGIIRSVWNMRVAFKEFVCYGAKYIDLMGGNSEAIESYKNFIKDQFEKKEWIRIKGAMYKKIKATVKFYELLTDAIHTADSVAIVMGYYEKRHLTLLGLTYGVKDTGDAKKAKKSASTEATETSESTKASTKASDEDQMIKFVDFIKGLSPESLEFLNGYLEEAGYKLTKTA